jgi:hypothetical protein
LTCLKVYALLLALGQPPALADAAAAYVYHETRCELRVGPSGWGYYQWTGIRRRRAIADAGFSLESQTRYALAEWRRLWPRGAARLDRLPAGGAAQRLWYDRFGRGKGD